MMPEIPEPLQQGDFRFIKVRGGEKRPFENNWQEDANYRYDNEELQRHIEQGGNYGIVGGYGNLVIIDCDQERVEHAVQAQLPETLKVRSGSGTGAHFYYICEDLENPIRLQENDAGDLGDVQCKGKQAVGPTCNHPSGGTYTIEEENEIAEVTAGEIRFALRKFMNKNKVASTAEKRAIQDEYDDDIELRITEVVDIAGLDKRGNELHGAHPIHGSSTGMNFWVNTAKNTWHCFRCDSGGGPLSWIAVKEGIINCGDATPGNLRGTDFKKAIEAGREDYGLPSPADKAEDNGLSWTRLQELFRDSDTPQKTAHHYAAKFLREKYPFKTPMDSQKLWIFTNPVYEGIGEQTINRELNEHLGKEVSSRDVKEITEKVKAATHIDRDLAAPVPHMIPVKNGWYNINENELQEPDPDVFVTNEIPFEYDEDAECPQFKEFIKEIVPTDDDVKLIQEMIGYCLYRAYPFDKAFMLLGEGGNGKSTLLDVVKHMLGDHNVASPNLQELTSGQYAKAELYNKLANINADLDKQAVNNSGIFKRLVGDDDTIRAREIYREPFEFKNHAKLIYAANQLPHTNDTQDAFFRRWVILEFPYQFKDNPTGEMQRPKKPDMNEQLKTDEEMRGLLNWAIDGLNRLLQQRHFTGDGSHADIKKKWMTQTNPLEVFVDDFVEMDEDAAVPKDDFVSAFNKFARRNGASPMKQRTITQKLAQLLPGYDDCRPRVPDDDRFEESRVRCYEGFVVTGEYGELVRLVQLQNSPSHARARGSSTDNIEHGGVEDGPSGPEGSQSLNSKRSLRDLVSELDDGDGTAISDIVAAVDVEEDRVISQLDNLLEEGSLFEPRPGYVKVL